MTTKEESMIIARIRARLEKSWIAMMNMDGLGKILGCRGYCSPSKTPYGMFRFICSSRGMRVAKPNDGGSRSDLKLAKVLRTSFQLWAQGPKRCSRADPSHWVVCG